jgi:hypothetical protein
MARHPFDGGDELTPEAHPQPGEWVEMDSSRVNRARYDTGLQQVQVVFRDGTPWVYDGVPEDVWLSFRSSSSPGRYINNVLDSYPYWHGAFES